MAFSFLEYLFVFYLIEIFMFLYYADDESDHVILGGSTKTVQHSIKNIS